MAANDPRTAAALLIAMASLAACGKETPMVDMPPREKCYGVAPAFQNDCATRADTNCAGTASTDRAPDRWQYVGKDECKDLGGTLEPRSAEKQGDEDA